VTQLTSRVSLKEDFMNIQCNISF